MTKPLGDKELLQRYLRGDMDAFEQFYRRYKDDLLIYIRALLGKALFDQADDAMQNLFLDFCANVEKALLLRDIRSYLFGMARNKAFDLRRALGRNQHLLAKTSKQPPLFQKLQNGGTEQEELANRASLAVLELPDDEREIFILREFQNFGFAAIASLTGLALSTVHDKHAKALEKLKILLRETKPYTGD